MKEVRVSAPETIEYHLAEHEVLLSFWDDEGAEYFDEWFYEQGIELFAKWCKEEKDYFFAKEN